MPPVDWTGLLGVFMGTLIVLIPVAGLTARFAFKPVVEAIAQFRQTPQANDRLSAIESRLALLENQMENTEAELTRLSDESEFRRKLGQGGES